jgi:hypothetical protein
MRHRSRCLVVLVAVAGALARGASAQSHPQIRDGFWIGFGLGYGSLGLGCSSCSGPREGALSSYLKLGGTWDPHLLVGVELDVWKPASRHSDDTLSAANLSAVFYYYPNPHRGLFLRGGVGLALLGVTGLDFPEAGPGAVLGAGYDVRVRAHTSITPVLNFNWGKEEQDKHNEIQFAVGVTFH